MTKTIKIHLLHCGRVRVDIGLPFRQTTGIARIHPGLAALGLFRSKKINPLPVSSFLIDHPKGLILLDTGSHTRYAGRSVENMEGYII